MLPKTQILFSLALCIWIGCEARSKYVTEEEDNPYEFGFTIDGQQHRHEKKDANGVIQGEFGFITADGIYHVTVYATDENGNFRILSMRNVRVSGPLDEPNAKLPDTSQFSKGQSNAAVANPLSISTTPAPAQTTRAVTALNNQFTTQPTIKPACAGCGYVTHKTPLTPLNKLPFQTGAGMKPASDVNGNEHTQSAQAPFVSNPVPVSHQRPQGQQGSFDGNHPNSPNHNYPQVGGGAHNDYRQSGGTQSQYPQGGSDQSQYPQGGNDQSQYPQGGGDQSQYPQGGGDQSQYPQGGDDQPQYPQGGGSSQPNHPNNNQQFPQSPSNYPQVTGPQDNTYDTNHPGNQPQSDPLLNPLSIANPNGQLNQPGAVGPSGITVANGMINVPNNPPIAIKDKFPNMVDGLPSGINEGDITDLLYKFNYTVGFQGHYEKGYKNGAKVGGYFVNDRDGVSRIVTYVADENGYRPKVKFIRLDLNSDLVPKEGTEKTFGLKNFEFVWYPLN